MGVGVTVRAGGDTERVGPALAGAIAGGAGGAGNELGSDIPLSNNLVLFFVKSTNRWGGEMKREKKREMKKIHNFQINYRVLFDAKMYSICTNIYFIILKENFLFFDKYKIIKIYILN